MSMWKLRRQDFGNEEYTMKEGEELTIGRNYDNKIVITSIVISRYHCVIHVKNDKILVTDLKSSNGVYVGTHKIPPNIPYCVKDSDIIGFGWTAGARLVDIKNSEKYMFKLIKERNTPSLIERIQFQNELDDIACFIDNSIVPTTKASVSPILSKNSLKRKSNDNVPNVIEEKPSVIDLISDSENETSSKKVKLETIDEEVQKAATIKKENDDLQLDAFKIKQEYLGYDDDAILINSDSENESESEQWIMRLSQSSPGKPFVKIQRESRPEKPEESSYSQVDDGLLIDISYSNDDENEEYLDDIIKIPEEPPAEVEPEDEYNDEGPPLILFPANNTEFEKQPLYSEKEISNNQDEGIDLVDAYIDVKTIRQSNGSVSDAVLEKLIDENIKNNCLKEPFVHQPKPEIIKPKSSSSHAPKSKKHKKHDSSSKKQISNSQKAERKKKLKELATKNKEVGNDLPSTSSDSLQSKKPKVNAKVTSSNRGAFLTDVGIVIPTKRSKSPQRSKKSKENLDKSKKQDDNLILDKQKKGKSKEKTQVKPCKDSTPVNQDFRIPLKNLKPLTCEKDSSSGKPCSKVEPLPVTKPKKKVRFSDEPPTVKVFEIEPGNKMMKTSMVKTAQVDRLRQVPMFSLEKVALMRVLHWNPNWLEEQLKTNDPPPILGAENPPPTVFHYFRSHAQYTKLIGDLLLLEIWECLTQAYMKIRDTNFEIPMRVECLPPAPPPGRFTDLVNISVNVSMPLSELKNMPRIGEIILISYGQDSVKNLRFFYVHHIRNLPSPSYNKNSFFSISLQTVYTDKMKFLKPGELITGRVLAYINKELMLFEALEYLARTPLCEAILKPSPQLFVNMDPNFPYNKNSQWSQALNASQHRAVAGALQAALGPQPALHMVQGPPGTGKSSVICAIVMSYFYDAAGQLERNRGKILICATSNAAVDELVIRLLNIRQSLPKAERFRMVRVGRAEAMQGRARDVSSAALAARDLARPRRPDRADTGRDHETAHLQAKINMWQTAAQDAKVPERVAYCKDRIQQLNAKIALLGAAGACGEAGGARGPQLAAAERRVIEKADIVATTLASAHNHKMRVLKGRIALCIIEEAGQAIEPETLVPLTLDVTNLTLIGDPQQLPGYICSQRAKKHGLGESLFSRLTSCSEQWPSGSPVVLLNEQYRMHREIAAYPNKAFYDGKIITRVTRKDCLPIAPYMILGISSGDKGQEGGGGNALEAWAVSRVAAALAGRLPGGASLAVLSPYAAHRDLIKSCLRTLLHTPADGGGVEVSTVDGFQGQERDVVLVSAARSCGPGFLADAGRLNVLLTRARSHLLLCLNPHAMLRNHQWRTLIEDAQKRNLYKTLPNKICQPPTSRDLSAEEILALIAPRHPYK